MYVQAKKYIYIDLKQHKLIHKYHYDFWKPYHIYNLD